jgi:hypothetical protein
VSTKRPPTAAAHRTTSALAVALAAAAALAAGACRGDEAKDLLRQSQAHLERAVEIVEAGKGDEVATLAALEAYRREHHQEILRLRREGAEKLAALPPEERAEFEAGARADTERLMTRVLNAARAYPSPQEIFLAVQKFR